MTDLYIGGQRPRRAKGAMKWKLFLFLLLLVMVGGAALKVASPFMVEKWLNQHGSGNVGYAYSVREVELSLKEGEMILKDVKVFHPESKVEFVKSPSLKLKMNLGDVLKSEDRKINISSDKLDVMLSSELTSEINRIKNSKQSELWYFSHIEAEFLELNVIEKKIDESRTLVKLQDVKLNMKELSLLSVNKNTEFSLASKLAGGGEMSLKGMMSEEEGRKFWSIEGALNEFSPQLLNRLAGNELPFTFNESVLNAQIIAHSREGKIEGEIVPEVSRLNLIDEKPGFARQVIARALNDELTFSLPFTLKDELTLQYADTYKKLKEYRKYSVSMVSFGQ